MNDRDLKRYAKAFERETGFTPINYNGRSDASIEERTQALVSDVDWYRRHTEDVAQRMRRLVQGR